MIQNFGHLLKFKLSITVVFSAMIGYLLGFDQFNLQHFTYLILGGFLVWFLWVQVEPIGYWLVDLITAPMDPDSPIRLHLLDSVAQMRLLTMGLFLLLMLRFYPRGMIPER